jgi:mRNA interferase MazF
VTAGLHRGGVWTANLPPPSGVRPVVLLTRDFAIPLLRNVTVVEVTRSARDLPTMVPLGKAEGLLHGCVANCDNLVTIPRAWLRKYLGDLGPAKMAELAAAIRVALDV